MATSSFTLKQLQHQTQLQLSSFCHCKYSSTLNTFQFYLSYEKHTLNLQANTPVAPRSEFTLSGDKWAEVQLSRNNNVNANFRSGFSSVTYTSKRGARKSLERGHIGPDEPIDQRRVILKDRHAKTRSNNISNSKREKQVSMGLSPKRKNMVRNTKNSTSNVIDEDAGKRHNGEKLERKEKRNTKPKLDTLETTLGVGLDICSRRGDVVGAIKLYYLARKEGVKIGQYHYAVLLYLCSSAAIGVVQPAKSGSSSRRLSSADAFQENPTVGSNEFSEMAKRSFCGSILSEQNPEADPVIEDSEENELRIDGNSAAVTNSVLSDGEEILSNSFNGSTDICRQTLHGLVQSMRKTAEDSNSRSDGSKGYGIQVNNDMKRYALLKGFEIYSEMRLEKVPLNEATFTSVARMAMALGDGYMAFNVVKQMKEYGVNPRLRSYCPALAIFCSNGDVENAFKVERHMLENGVYPEDPELEALLKVSIEAGKSDKVYYVFHKLRTSVRQVSPTTAHLIEKWFRSKVASRVGKRKWDQELIIRAMENGGGGWHGKGWLGKGKWSVHHTAIHSDGVCKCCGTKLVTIDLDPAETENFAKSVASIAAQREKNSSFQKFQKWLDYYGSFEAVVDAANVGLYSQRRFKPSKVNAVANGIRQMLPSRKWPLIVLHNRRITRGKMDEPFNRALIEKWKNADALYATPTGSNDDWYWLYAAIKCKCLIVTNDEMRDHLFQLLGNDFFPKWKERHQVHFSFTETGPTFRMPPPCSVVIQESEKGHWHVPIVSELENEDERIWLCCTRRNSSLANQDYSDVHEEAHQKKRQTRNWVEPILVGEDKHACSQPVQGLSLNAVSVAALLSEWKNDASILPQLEAAEKHGSCMIDFQI